VREHLLTVVNDILDVSKVDAENDGRAHQTNLRNCSREFESLLRREPKTKDSPESSIGQAIRSRCSPDPTRLRQVLMNLIGNAIKFTDSGSVKLESGSSTKTKGCAPCAVIDRDPAYCRTRPCSCSKPSASG